MILQHILPIKCMVRTKLRHRTTEQRHRQNNTEINTNTRYKITNYTDTMNLYNYKL